MLNLNGIFIVRINTIWMSRDETVDERFDSIFLLFTSRMMFLRSILRVHERQQQHVLVHPDAELDAQLTLLRIHHRLRHLLRHAHRPLPTA